MKALRIALLLLVSLLALWPLYWQVLGSFMTPLQASKSPPPLILAQLDTDNYFWVLRNFAIFRWLWNSIVVCLGTVALQLAVSLPAAYALEIKKFRGSRAVWTMFVASMMLSGQLLLIPSYRLIRALGMTTNRVGLILPFALSVFSVFVIQAYLTDFPREVLDSADIDGAGEARKLAGIVAPMCIPVLTALGTMAAVGAWNNFLWQSLIANTDRTRTLVVGIARQVWDSVFYHLNEEATRSGIIGDGTLDYGLLMAGAVIVFLPMGLLFVFSWRYVMKGLYANREK